MKSKKWARRRSGCKECYDGYYPSYGAAPGKQVRVEFTPPIVLTDGSLVTAGYGHKVAPILEWPENFEPDPEQVDDFENNGIPIAHGTWYCPKCYKKE